MKRRWLCGVLGGVAGCLFLGQAALAGSSEMEILLKKLQEKGVLTADEATNIAAETKKAAADVKETNKAKETKVSDLPDWVKNTKVKGDLRLRYENSDKKDDARGSVGRERFRLRAGAETTITDGLSIGFGLASGTGDQRSANQTLTNSFTRKNVWIDYAYARYAPTKWFSVTGGKFTNPIWQPSDMLISTDVNPEGGAVRLEGQVTSNLGLFLNGALFVIDDRNGTSPYTTDPLMYTFQPGVKWNITKDMFVRFSPAYYGLSDFKGMSALSATGLSTSNTNTLASGNYRYNYSIINWGGEFGWNKPFGISAIPYLGIMGGYAKNPDPSDDNQGYLAGVTVGYPDVKKFGDWSVEYTFRRIEKDAWIDVLPDSSFYGGNTNVMGHRVKVLFGLAKNTSLGLNYYNTWLVRNFNPTTSTTKASGTAFGLSKDQQLLQADLIFKF
jgi:hypothetical protein